MTKFTVMTASNRLSISNFKCSKVFILFNNLCELFIFFYSSIKRSKRKQSVRDPAHFEIDFILILFPGPSMKSLWGNRITFKMKYKMKHYLKTCRIWPGPPYSADHPCGVQKEKFHAQLTAK
jgi:hypothetical protein